MKRYAVSPAQWPIAASGVEMPKRGRKGTKSLSPTLIIPSSSAFPSQMTGMLPSIPAMPPTMNPVLRSYVQTLDSQCAPTNWDINIPQAPSVNAWLNARQPECKLGYKNIGEGSYGAVYRCADPDAKEATKVVKMPNAQYCGRNQSEATIPNLVKQRCDQAQLPCPVATVLETRKFKVGNDTYMALDMPLFRGGSADEYFFKMGEQIRTMSPQHFVENYLDLSILLRELHGEPFLIAHRDIKPSNLLMNEDHSKLFLADFGIQCYNGNDWEIPTDMRCYNTPNAGTTRYLSPAILFRNNTPFDNDNFALALSMLEILLREPYYNSATYNALKGIVQRRAPTKSNFDILHRNYAKQNNEILREASHIANTSRFAQPGGNPLRFIYAVFCCILQSHPSRLAVRPSPDEVIHLLQNTPTLFDPTALGEKYEPFLQLLWESYLDPENPKAQTLYFL